jgi:hypothetical protein
MGLVSLRHLGLEKQCRVLLVHSKLRLSTTCSAPQRVLAWPSYETELLLTLLTQLNQTARVPPLARRHMCGMTMMRARFAFTLPLALPSKKAWHMWLQLLTRSMVEYRFSGQHKLELWESNTSTQTRGVPLGTWRPMMTMYVNLPRYRQESHWPRNCPFRKTVVIYAVWLVRPAHPGTGDRPTQIT